MTAPTVEPGPEGNPAPTTPTAATVRCRRIEAADIGALSALLAQGFPVRSAAKWRGSLFVIHSWTERYGLPQVGFVLMDGKAMVGCLLTIYSPDGQRCSFSSWYVAEGYRRFGTILVSAALRDRSVTYLNISSEKETRPIIEAQGFRRYSEGVVLAAPLLSPAGLFRGKVHWSDPRPPSVVPPAEHELMVDHAALGCICFWCEDAGAVHPFVMAKRPFKAGIPVAQVVYCPPGIDWRRLSGAVGRAMARHRLFLLLIDAAGPIPGLPGHFFAGRMPKYRRGPLTPQLGDLSYTEAALIGT